MSERPLLGRSLRADAFRFLVAGGINALLTLLVYQALLFALPHQLAYLLAWVAGLLFVMLAYPSRVFPEGRAGIYDKLVLGVTYVGVFLFGFAVLEGLTRLGLAPRLGIFLVMIATSAANFLLARLLLRR